MISMNHVSGQNQSDSKKNLSDSILADTTDLKDLVLRKEIVELANLIQREKGLDSELFPFSKFDSVVVYRFNKETPLYLEYKSENERNELAPLQIYRKGVLRKDLKFENGKRLNDEQIQNLKNYINTPLNFQWGYLSGADFTKGIIAFYYHRKIESHIHVSSLNVISCTPKNIKIKHGILSNNSDNFRNLLTEIGL